MSSRAAKSALLHAFLWAIGLSYGFSDWSVYRQKFVRAPDGWRQYLRGGIEAPFQYRIGNWIVVDWMDRLFHVKPYNTLTMIDVLCLVFALWAVLRVLHSCDRFKNIPSGTGWLATAGVLFLAEYYLAWGHWFQTEVTLPSILFVALSVALVYGGIVRNRLLACFLLVVLGWIQGFIRADVAVILHGGFFLAIIFNRRASVPLGRFRMAATSLLTALIAGCAQLYLMFVRFPNARYGASGPVRLASNIHPDMWLPMLLALFPYWLLLGLIVVKRYRTDTPTTMLLTASVLYLAVWATVGLLDEVRIFLPFAFALAPATTLALIGLLPETRSVPQTAILD